MNLYTAEEVNRAPFKRTPLPAGQISILLFLRFCESASTSVIYPFLDELLASVAGGDEEKVGYYAGVMEFTRQLVSLVIVLYWSRLSDHIGRKPILLLGTLALAVSMTSFGLSRVFWGLVVSRCIFTSFNSNAGVIRGMIGEITDNTNSADAFAFLHVPWAVGYSFGALIGGWLARPHDHFPRTFPGRIWVEHPYFLPCFSMACLSLFGCVVLIFHLKETVKGGYLYKGRSIIENETSEPLLALSPSDTISNTTNEDPTPIRALLTRRILTPVANYAILSSLHASSNSIQPLFLAMPIAIGGLALSPRTVGYILGAYGILNSFFQILLLGRLVRRFGARNVFITSMMALLPIFMLPPIMNIYVRSWGFNGLLWVLLAIQLISSLIMELGYGCIYMFTTASAPNKRSLGTVNGLAQTAISVGRIVVPAMASGLLSFSIQYRILGGYVAYLALAMLTVGGIVVAQLLPANLDDN